MIKSITFLALFITTTFQLVSQKTVDVADLTLKIKGKETIELYYGFANGDQIIFNFEEASGKSIKEIEILELPSNSKFMDYKTSKIKNKIIKVNQNSVYRFSIRNSSLRGRVCKIKIERIAATDATVNFNTDWVWKSYNDTVLNPYTQDSIIGYDTLNFKETVQELDSTIQSEVLLFDKQQRVHSSSNANSEKAWLSFKLPMNETTALRTTEVVSWAYWVGVGDEAQKAWKRNVKIVGGIAKGVTKIFSPLGALAVGVVSELMVPRLGEDVSYEITNLPNKELFKADLPHLRYDHGKGVAGYRTFNDKDKRQGTYFVCLQNDNKLMGIDVTVKVIAILETKTFKSKQFNRSKITPRTVTLHKQKMDVIKSRERVNAN